MAPLTLLSRLKASRFSRSLSRFLVGAFVYDIYAINGADVDGLYAQDITMNVEVLPFNSIAIISRSPE